MVKGDILRLVELAEWFGYWQGDWHDWHRYLPAEADEYQRLLRQVQQMEG